MKLVIAIVQESDVSEILDALADSGFGSTQITSAGGFLREPNVTLLIGVQEADVPRVVHVVDQNSNARRMFVNPLMPMVPVAETRHLTHNSSSVRVGASVFVVNVERFVRMTE